MCVLVRLVDTDSPAWSPADVAIDLPRGFTYREALLIVRTVLTAIGAQQPTGSGAVCFCGDTVTVPGLHPVSQDVNVVRLPARQPPSLTEVPRGA